MNRPEIKPTLDIPMSVAAEELTGWEMLAIEKRFGKAMDALSAPAVLMGVVWCYRNRDGQKTSWTEIEKMTMRELAGFFAPEPVEPDEDETLGKDEQQTEN